MIIPREVIEKVSAEFTNEISTGDLGTIYMLAIEDMQTFANAIAAYVLEEAARQ